MDVLKLLKSAYLQGLSDAHSQERAGFELWLKENETKINKITKNGHTG